MFRAHGVVLRANNGDFALMCIGHQYAYTRLTLDLKRGKRDA